VKRRDVLYSQGAVWLLATILLVLPLAGCGQAEPPEAEPPEAEAEAEAEAGLEESDLESRRRIVRDLFDVLGVSGSASQWTQVASVNMVQFQDALAPETIQQLQAAAAEAYAPGPLLDQMVEHFVENFDEAATLALLEYYRSPAGQELAKAAVVQPHGDGTTSLDGYLAVLAKTPPSENRLALAERMTVASRQAEQSVDTLLAVSRTNLRAVEPLLPGKVSDEALAAREADIRQTLLERARQQTAVSSLYSVRDLDDEALRIHVEFTESGYFRWYVEQLGPAVERAIGSAGKVLSERVAELRAT
jgi:hypothetical protein